MTDYVINVTNLTDKTFTFSFYASTPDLRSPVWIQEPVAGGGGTGSLHFTTQWQVCQVVKKQISSTTTWTSGSFKDVDLSGKKYTLNDSTMWDDGKMDQSIPPDSVGADNESKAPQYLGISVKKVAIAVTNDSVYSGTTTVMAITPTYYLGVAISNVIVGQVVNASNFGNQILQIVFKGKHTYDVTLLINQSGNLELQPTTVAHVAKAAALKAAA